MTKRIDWQRVERLRKKLGNGKKPLSWKLFAEEVGISVRTLWNWRAGRHGKWAVSEDHFRQQIERLERRAK